jgi:hypothetical protein
MRTGTVYDLEQCVGDRFLTWVEENGFPVRKCHPFGNRTSEFVVLRKDHVGRTYNGHECIGRMLDNQYFIVYSPDGEGSEKISDDVLILHELAKEFR